MAKYKITLQDGTIDEIEGNATTIYIGGIAYKFVMHKDPFGYYVLTHKDSGMQVGRLSVMRSGTLPDRKESAQKLIRDLVDRRGADYVRKVIDERIVKGGAK